MAAGRIEARWFTAAGSADRATTRAVDSDVKISEEVDLVTAALNGLCAEVSTGKRTKIPNPHLLTRALEVALQPELPWREGENQLFAIKVAGSVVTWETIWVPFDRNQPYGEVIWLARSLKKYLN